jgi:polyhydroxybutyrate depolymerase
LFVLVNVTAGKGRPAAAAPGRDTSQSMVYKGLKRTYLLHTPTGHNLNRTWPLVFVLHGGGGSGAKVARLTGFSRLADSTGIIVVYPDAVNHHWNDGRKVRHFRSQRENVDDVGLVSALIDRLVKDLNADPQQVYVTGISNGGMMCHRLACEMSDKIAAIAPVAAALPEPLADSCNPARPVSVLAINGTEDPLVSYQGGGVGLVGQRGRVLSVRETIEHWVKADACSAVPDTARLPDLDPLDGITVVRETHGSGKQGIEVILYRVEGGGHTWPSGAERIRKFGPTARDIDATRLIWEFFSRHPRQ